MGQTKEMCSLIDPVLDALQIVLDCLKSHWLSLTPSGISLHHATGTLMNHGHGNPPKLSAEVGFPAMSPSRLRGVVRSRGRIAPVFGKIVASNAPKTA